MDKNKTAEEVAEEIFGSWIKDLTDEETNED